MISSRSPGMSAPLSAGFVVARKTAETWRYLLLRAYDYWDFPKGLAETGENPLETARREVAEETGITDLQLSWGVHYYETPPYRGGKVARYFLAATTDDKVTLGINPELGRPEHHEYRWLDYDSARALLVPRVQAVLDWAAANAEPERFGTRLPDRRK